MQRRSGPWNPWEYAVLHEGLDAEATARRLGRDVGEVRRKQDPAFAEWYRRRRCPGSPEEPDCIVRVARRIYEEDGHWRRITGGELEALLLEQARMCFRYFDPRKWSKDLTDREKFVRYFVTCWRRMLKRAGRRMRRERARNEPLVADVAVEGHRGAAGEDWPRLLFRTALGRLPAQARRYVELHYLEGLGREEVAARLGLKLQTVYNKYSVHAVASLVRTAIGEMMRGLPEGSLAAIVRHLHDDADRNEGAVARLLCIPRSAVDTLLARPAEAWESAGGEIAEILDGSARRAA